MDLLEQVGLLAALVVACVLAVRMTTGGRHEGGCGRDGATPPATLVQITRRAGSRRPEE